MVSDWDYKKADNFDILERATNDFIKHYDSFVHEFFDKSGYPLAKIQDPDSEDTSDEDDSCEAFY